MISTFHNPYTYGRIGRNIKFKKFFDDADDFKTSYKASAFYTNEISDANINLIYGMLMARYANEAIASDSPQQFADKLFLTIFQYAPAWLKELDIQKKIRALTLDELQAGSITVINNALNPEQSPSTNAFDPLSYINAQNASMTKKSEADAYALQMDLMTRDVTEPFLNRFKKLFMVVVEPELPMFY